MLKNIKYQVRLLKLKRLKLQKEKKKVPVSIEKSKKAAKKIIKKYDNIRRENKFKKIVDTVEKKRKTEKIDVVDELKDASLKKKKKMLKQPLKKL